MVRHREQISFPRCSISGAPQAGHAGRVGSEASARTIDGPGGLVGSGLALPPTSAGSADSTGAVSATVSVIRPERCHFGGWLRFIKFPYSASRCHFGGWLRFINFPLRLLRMLPECGTPLVGPSDIHAPVSSLRHCRRRCRIARLIG